MVLTRNTDQTAGQEGRSAASSWRLGAFVAGLSASAVAVGVALGVRGPQLPSGSDWIPLAGFAGCMVAAEYLIIRFRFRGEINGLNLVEAILAPMLLAFPGPIVMGTVAITQTVAAVLRRNAPIKASFNIAQWTLAAGVGASVMRALRESSANLDIAAATVVTLIAVALVNQTAFMGALALSNRAGFKELFRGLAPVIVPGWLIGWVTNTLVGLLFAFAYQGSRWSVLLFPVPLVILHLAYRGYAGARTDRIRLAGLHQAAQILAEPLDPRAAIAPFLREVAKCFEATGAALVLPSDEGLEVHTFNVGAESATVEIEVEAGRDALQAIAAQGGTKPQRVIAASSQPFSALLQRAGYKDCLMAPLIDGGSIRGALMVFEQAGLEGFEQGELAVIEALARETAAALAKGLLLEAMLEERRKLSEIVGSATDGMLTISDGGIVRAWNPAMQRITGIPAEGMVDVPGALSSLHTRASDGSLLMLERWIESERLPPDLWIAGPDGRSRHLSCSYNPVVDRSGAKQTLVIVARDITSQDEMEELRERVDRLAEQEVAQRIVVESLQQALMPPQPKIAGVELGVDYLPSDATSPTGGDLYDWQILPSGELHLAVVDVLGHGVTATKDAVAVIHVLRLLALQDCPLELMIARADALLRRQKPDLVSTLVIGRYDAQRGRLRLATGGHPPPLIASRMGGVRELPLSGGAIGWPGAGSKTVVDVQLEPDDVLILYTDGLVEAGRDIIGGTEALIRHSQELMDLPAEAMARGLVHRALSGTIRHDDSLALVLRHQPTNVGLAHASWSAPPDAEKLSNARRELDSWLRTQGVEEGQAQDLVLIASELLSNSMAAARTRVTVRAWMQPDRVIIEVEDDGYGDPNLFRAGLDLPAPHAEGGRGLFIVRSLAQEVTSLSGFEGTTVRCTYALAANSWTPIGRSLEETTSGAEVSFPGNGRGEGDLGRSRGVSGSLPLAQTNHSPAYEKPKPHE